jgi:phospholipid-binding lipoprotein MlaA
MIGLIAAMVMAQAAPDAAPEAPAPRPVAAAPVEHVRAEVMTAPVGDATQPVNDPFQGFNRASFGFSMGLDKVLIGPITHGYMAVTPSVIRNRVSAVVYNIGEPSTVINDVLQGHPRKAGRATSRFVINSTVGLLGLFDVAGKMGIPSHDGDFGQTLGRYKVQPGPYIYVPVVGPLQMREAVGRAFDFVTDPVSIIGGGYKTTFGATRLAVTTLDTRALGDGAFRALDDATDPYVTVRSAYGQHRAALVREATGEVQALPDFDTPPAAPTPPPAR